MARRTPTRLASYVVSARQTATADFGRLLGHQPDDTGTDRNGDRYWKVIEAGDDAQDVTQLVERLVDRLEPLTEALRRLSDEPDVTCLLRVVIYAAPDDAAGPGFALRASVVRFLAATGAFVDADIYCDAPG